MEEIKEVRKHRVGTVTLGLTLMIFGSLYLLRLFIPALPVEPVVHLWPAALIILGAEVLFAGIGRKEFVIDRASVFLVFLEVIFLFGMAAAETILRYMESVI
ncbi:MAG: hypothetical protein K5686_06810 [Lachnospiraceae bacterium]|nr:hypothetical protein [Lachnospiraceae bacterium]